MAVVFWVMFALLLVCIAVNFLVMVSCVYQQVGQESQYVLFSVAGDVDDVKLAIVRTEGEIGALERYSRGTDELWEDFPAIGPAVIANVHERAIQECMEIRRSLDRISVNGRSFIEKSWPMRRSIILKFCLDVLVVLVALMFVPWS